MPPSHSSSTLVGTHLQSQARVGTLRWPPMAARPLLNKITDAGVSVCNSLSTRILLGRRSSGGAGALVPWEAPIQIPRCPPAPPRTQDSLPVDVVVPVQVQDAAGHLARHPLQGQQVRGHGLGPPAAPQVPLQVTLRAVPLSPSVPSTHGGTVGSGAQGLTSGQNSITSRYGVTSAHWARHCSRLVCWRALRGHSNSGVCAPWPCLCWDWHGRGSGRPQGTLPAGGMAAVPPKPSSCQHRGCQERVPACPSARDVSQRDICSAVLGQEQPRAPPAWSSSAHDLTTAPCHGQWPCTALVLP